MRFAFALTFSFTLVACGAPPEVVDDAGVTDAGPEPLGSCVDRCVDNGGGDVKYFADWQPESPIADVTCCECQEQALARFHEQGSECFGVIPPFVGDEACPLCPTPET